MRLTHRPNRAALDQFNDPPIVVFSMDLSAHLGGNLGLGSRLGDDTGLLDRMAQRLFGVDVLAQFQGA